ncbi:hypothetical protein [Variovorax sp. 3P27G3]|jgi:hypothetical protein|uniref:hypothetical protein n=1 Tax=Variovorax sp. 3P27G3 TaxID=2502214 RepID=UPI0010F8CF9F|nr:hypothetical protein [Variovorax sp. 3P27G3]
MNNKVLFHKLPLEAVNISHLGSLVFDKRKTLGSGAFMDLTTESVHDLLARDLIACLGEYSSPSRISGDQALFSYFTAIREVLAYCKTQQFPEKFRLADFSFDAVLDYRRHLQIQFAAYKSGTASRRYGNFKRLLEAGSRIKLAPPGFNAPRIQHFVADSDRTQPYSSGELLDIEEACRTHIRELSERLELGKTLLAKGIDPRGKTASAARGDGRFSKIPPSERKWNQLENLLWYVVNVMDGEYLDRSKLLANGHSSFNGSTTGVYKGPYRKRDVYSHLYPLAEDMIPFVLLLALTTGRNESSILGLRRDCVREINGGYVLDYVKARGARRSYTRRISDEGPFSAVKLIRLVRRLTEPLVTFASPADKNFLLLGLTIKGHGSRPVKPVDATYLKYQMNGEGKTSPSFDGQVLEGVARMGWCYQRELKTDAGDDLIASMRRLRVSYLTNRYRRTGQLAKVSRDAVHSVPRTTVPYIDNDATKHLHDEAIERGIKAARNLAVVAVVSDEDPVTASESLGVDLATATRLLSGKQDVFFAACRDFFNRPDGPSNTPCDRAWACLFCSNAVITTHVLPRLIKFRDFVNAQRAVLPDSEWSIRFAEVAEVMHKDVFPNFSSSAIAHAEGLAAEEVLYLPLEFKV